DPANAADSPDRRAPAAWQRRIAPGDEISRLDPFGERGYDASGRRSCVQGLAAPLLTAVSGMPPSRQTRKGDAMRFGLMIRGQYPQGDDMRVRLREDLNAAKRAEALGYELVVKGSHYSSHPFQYIQQIPYLCQVALIAPKLRLLPGVVLLPLHSPLHVAEELASLDVMSDGKLIFGAGIGYREVEFKAFGGTRKHSGGRS